MYLLGHVGITLAAGLLINKFAFPHSQKTAQVNSGTILIDNCKATEHSLSINKRYEKFKWLTEPLNPGILLAGSLLPDIIDKPLGIFILGDIISNGRTYSHTLIFIILLSFAGWLLWKWKGKLWLLTLGFGAFLHLILDKMWLEPSILLWPAFGIGIAREDISNWVENAYVAMFINPGIYIPEIIGACILIWYVFMLVYNRNLLTFMKSGS